MYKSKTGISYKEDYNKENFFFFWWARRNSTYNPNARTGENRELKITSHTTQQSWFTPFSPLCVWTHTKLFELSAWKLPQDLRIISFFFASLASASAASLPPSSPRRLLLLLSLRMDREFASPFSIEENCCIVTVRSNRQSGERIGRTIIASASEMVFFEIWIFRFPPKDENFKTLSFTVRRWC